VVVATQANGLSNRDRILPLLSKFVCNPIRTDCAWSGQKRYLIRNKTLTEPHSAAPSPLSWKSAC
jgi:hypothetical protein